MSGVGILEQLYAEVRAIRAELAELRAELRGKSQLVGVGEYAAARSINVSTVRAAIRTGRLPSKRIGRAVRVPADVEIAAVERSRPSKATELAERRLGVIPGGRR